MGLRLMLMKGAPCNQVTRQLKMRSVIASPMLNEVLGPDLLKFLTDISLFLDDRRLAKQLGMFTSKNARSRILCHDLTIPSGRKYNAVSGCGVDREMRLKSCPCSDRAMRRDFIQDTAVADLRHLRMALCLLIP